MMFYHYDYNYYIIISIVLVMQGALIPYQKLMEVILRSSVKL